METEAQGTNDRERGPQSAGGRGGVGWGWEGRLRTQGTSALSPVKPRYPPKNDPNVSIFNIRILMVCLNHGICVLSIITEKFNVKIKSAKI